MTTATKDTALQRIRATLTQNPTRSRWMSEGVRNQDQNGKNMLNRKSAASQISGSDWNSDSNPYSMEIVLENHDRLAEENTIMARKIYENDHTIKAMAQELAALKAKLKSQERVDAIKALEQSLHALQSVKIGMEFPPISFDVRTVISAAIHQADQVLKNKL